MSDAGLGLNVGALQEIVGNLVKEMGLKTPFKNGRPGLDWVYGYEYSFYVK